jgi:cyclopropane fatty-acyl-phospholipid synthase-like methyltransferase
VNEIVYALLNLQIHSIIRFEGGYKILRKYSHHILKRAKLVGKTGKVIAADLQQGMLQILHAKIKGTILESRMKLEKCEKDNINVSETVDFILTFYMVHEVPDKNAFFKQLYGVLKDQGQYLLVEPKLFHVSHKEFQSTIALAQNIGFESFPGPKLLASWSAILRKKTK